MDQALIADLEAHRGNMQTWFEWLHQHPELSGQETETANHIANLLEGWGYDVVRNIGGTGIVATMKCGDGTATIGLRSELDALPIQEDGPCQTPSLKPGVSHLCGHDGHMTMLLGAAEYLARTKNFNGTLRLIFQPAEENFTGALAMIDDGLFERFPVDALFGMHNSAGREPKKIFLKSGSLLNAADKIFITVKGVGAHGGFPHLGCDPVVAGASIVMALQTIVSRNINPQDIGIITVGAFNAGVVENIIPETAELKLSVRSASPEGHELLIRRIYEVAENQAKAFGCTVEIEHPLEGKVVVNDEDLKQKVVELATERLGAENVDPVGFREMASEDFANYCGIVPTFYAMIGNGEGPVNHNPAYTFCQDDFVMGAAYWVTIAEGFLA
jgi:hippurate hydrolase